MPLIDLIADGPIVTDSLAEGEDVDVLHFDAMIRLLEGRIRIIVLLAIAEGESPPFQPALLQQIA